MKKRNYVPITVNLDVELVRQLRAKPERINRQIESQFFDMPITIINKCLDDFVPALVGLFLERTVFLADAELGSFNTRIEKHLDGTVEVVAFQKDEIDRLKFAFYWNRDGTLVGRIETAIESFYEKHDMNILLKKEDPLKTLVS